VGGPHNIILEPVEDLHFELERTFNFSKVPKFSKKNSFSYIRNHFELFLGLEA
jgi:hypothetical protein